MAIKTYKKSKKKSKAIIVNGVEYRSYKKSKEVFLEHQQENSEDLNRKHIAFLSAADAEKQYMMHAELDDEIKRGK